MSRARRFCEIPGCGRPRAGRGWCNAHYLRFRRHGSPISGRATMDGEPLSYLRDVVLQHRSDSCLFWPYARDNHGYARIGGDLVSRLVCQEVNGQAPSSQHEAAHSCGNGNIGCVSGRHLSWKTHAENMADTIDHGTSKRGSENPMAKLTSSQVSQIVELRGRMPQRAIARLYQISQSAVSDIHLGRRWAHQTGKGSK